MYFLFLLIITQGHFPLLLEREKVGEGEREGERKRHQYDRETRRMQEKIIS